MTAPISEADLIAAARKALSVLDLTQLEDDCTEADVTALCDKARSPEGNVAAICIWPRFVAHARAVLGEESPVRIATVVNFPSGDLAVEDVVGETAGAIADGADEIDLVMPYRAFMEGDTAAADEMIRAVRAVAAAPARLKVILETGVLENPDLIRAAAELAIECGADFVKTSTGKVKVNATLEAAEVMLGAVKASGKRVGFKPAGGIRTVEVAKEFMDTAAAIMGEDYVTPETFRIGASGVYGAILAVLTGEGSTTAPAGY